MATHHNHSAAQTKEAAQKQQRTRPDRQPPTVSSFQANPLSLQRAVADPSAASPHDILALQRLYGNRAVTRLLQARASTASPAVQRQGDGGFEASSHLEQSLNAQKGGGSPLPGETRAFMEPRFGADFSGVRVHADAQADQMNREIQAQAFTHGQDIYMGAGRYDPGSDAGKHLLAHELTHVVQQGGGTVQGASSGTVRQKISRSKEVVQRYEVMGPPGTSITARVNNLEVNKVAGTARYVLKQQPGVGLRVSMDHRMAVPNVAETKDFYSTAALITAADAVLQSQGSIVSLSQGPVFPTLQSRNGMPLYRVNVTSKTGQCPALDDMAIIQNECIKTAQMISTGAEGGENPQAILGGTGTSSQALQYPNIPTTIGGFVSNLPEGRKQALGVNKYAVPEMGQIMATFDLLPAVAGRNTWSYHFAAVVARSGNDYVTLENVNRASEVNEALDAVWTVLGRTKEGIRKYQEALELYSVEGLGPEERAEQTRKAQVYVLRQLAETQTKTNLLGEIAGAVWYFQMYGPLEQSFHEEMAGSGAFGEAFTVRLGKAPEGGPLTEGIDPRVFNIVEPEQPKTFKEKRQGAAYHKTPEGRLVEQLKDDARSLAKTIKGNNPNFNGMFENRLTTLDNRLAGLHGRTADKARYTLQILHLRLGIRKKALEIRGKLAESEGTRRKLAPVYGNEVHFYGDTLTTVLGHKTLNIEFKGAAGVMVNECQQMERANLEMENSIVGSEGATSSSSGGGSTSNS